jgi:hypothetical protein
MGKGIDEKKIIRKKKPIFDNFWSVSGYSIKQNGKFINKNIESRKLKKLKKLQKKGKEEEEKEKEDRNEENKE